MKLILSPAAVLTLSLILAPSLPGEEAAAPRPVATYSIVAYDPASGQLGVAVQSHWFSVGAIVSWAELLKRLPGVGQFPDDAELLKRILALLPREGKGD